MSEVSVLVSLLLNSPMSAIHSEQRQQSPLKTCDLIQVNQNGKKNACVYVCWGERGWVRAQGLGTETGRREERTEEF